MMNALRKQKTKVGKLKFPPQPTRRKHGVD